ncbi:MAG: hypothetical protein IPM92_14420 [Saprospiraceae bacterium]|nr:hypothetical protein [Saprospiraceae bacterium]
MKNPITFYISNRSILYNTISSICLTFFLSSCGLLDSEINQETHKTQITVSLVGKLAADEVATVSLNGEVIGTASKNEVATKEVEPDKDYKISAVDSEGKSAWSSETVQVKAGQTLNYNLNCDHAQLKVYLEPNCQTPGKVAYPMRVNIMRNGKLYGAANDHLYEGDTETTVDLHHGDIKININDLNQVVYWSNAVTYFKYGSTLTVTISCP